MDKTLQLNMITFKEIDGLNRVLGSLRVKALDSDTFLKMLGLKQEVEEAAKRYYGLRERVFEEYEVARNYDGSVQVGNYSSELLNNLARALEDLGRKEQELNAKLLQKEQLEDLRQDNDLPMGDFALLYKLLVV